MEEEVAHKQENSSKAQEIIDWVNGLLKVTRDLNF